MARPPAVPAPPPAAFRGTSKRERILRAAVDVFARNGYFNAKVAEIAKAAGVADGTIYLYFDGKEDLLINIFRESTRNFLVSLEAHLAQTSRPEERVRAAVRHHLESLGRDRALAVVSQVELRHSLKFMSLFSKEEVTDYLNLLKRIVEQGQAEGDGREALFCAAVIKPAPLAVSANSSNSVVRVTSALRDFARHTLQIFERNTSAVAVFENEGDAVGADQTACDGTDD